MREKALKLFDKCLLLPLESIGNNMSDGCSTGVVKVAAELLRAAGERDKAQALDQAYAQSNELSCQASSRNINWLAEGFAISKPDLPRVNSVVRALSDERRFSDVMQCLQYWEAKNVVTLEARADILLCCFEHGCWKESLTLFPKKFKVERFLSDFRFASGFLKHCGWMATFQAFQECVKRTETSSCIALMRCLAKENQGMRCLDLCEALHVAPVARKYIVDEALQQRLPASRELLQQVFAWCVASRHAPSRIHVEKLIESLDWRRALEVLHKCRMFPTFNLSAAHLRAALTKVPENQWERCLTTASDVQAVHHVVPDEATIQVLVKAAARNSWAQAFNVMQLYTKKHSHPTIKTLTHLHAISLLAKNWELSLQVFSRISEWFGHNNTHKCARISCCALAQCGMWRRAAEMFAQVVGEDIPEDSVTIIVMAALMSLEGYHNELHAFVDLMAKRLPQHSTLIVIVHAVALACDKQFDVTATEFDETNIELLTDVAISVCKVVAQTHSGVSLSQAARRELKNLPPLNTADVELTSRLLHDVSLRLGKICRHSKLSPERELALSKKMNRVGFGHIFLKALLL